MPSKNQQILEALGFLSTQAADAGFPGLAADIDKVVAAHGDAPQTPAQPVTQAGAPDLDARVEEIVAERVAQAAAAYVGYLDLIAKIHDTYRHVVMDTDADRAAHAQLVETADAALSLVRGLLQSASDDVADLGSFAQYADEADAQPAAEPQDVAVPAEPGLDDDDDTLMAALGEQVDAAMYAAAVPTTVTLYFRGVDGYNPDRAAATEALEMCLPAMAHGFGEFTAGDITDGEHGLQVVLTAADGNLALAGLAGRDGFNSPALPVAGGDVVVTSQVGQPADPQAAEELGLAGIDLPDVPEGQHPINGVLIMLEEETGYRPEAANLLISYRREDGRELTDDLVTRIVNHPVSQHPTHGLPRFGQLALIGIEPGNSPAEKTARFGILAAGEIDPAGVSSFVRSVGYGGPYDFSKGRDPIAGLGVVWCTSDAELVPVNVDV